MRYTNARNEILSAALIGVKLQSALHLHVSVVCRLLSDCGIDKLRDVGRIRLRKSVSGEARYQRQRSVQDKVDQDDN